MIRLQKALREVEWPDPEDTVGTTCHPKGTGDVNRVERALSNLRNVGGVSDVSSILKSQSENDEALIHSSYLKIQGFVWAIPVLGFIGTVMGLSKAIGNFAGTLQADTANIEAIKSNLTNVTGGLSVAFETTLIALVAFGCICLVVCGCARLHWLH